ncbi:MAG: hypothetical protein KBC84_03170 [Proteobacteria bacterium]|nr:hypothetical protein [Pseudomonadota bacterium]
MNNKIKYLILSLVFSLSITSCGRKNTPRPPEDFVLSPVANINTTVDANSINLSWTAPAVNVKNQESDIVLSKFIVRRAEVTLSKTSAYQDLAEISVKHGNSQPTPVTYSYKDKDLLKSKVYQYVIVPVDNNGDYGLVVKQIRVAFIGINSRVDNVDFINK